MPVLQRRRKSLACGEPCERVEKSWSQLLLKCSLSVREHACVTVAVGHYRAPVASFFAPPAVHAVAHSPFQIRLRFIDPDVGNPEPCRIVTRATYVPTWSTAYPFMSHLSRLRTHVMLRQISPMSLILGVAVCLEFQKATVPYPSEYSSQTRCTRSQRACAYVILCICLSHVIYSRNAKRVATGLGNINRVMDHHSRQ